MRNPDTTGSPAETAAEYRLQVHRDYGRATAEARNAARYYKMADSYRRQAALLTASPDLWSEGPEGVNPARSENIARSIARMADVYLRGHFRAVESARFHAGLARAYDEIAAAKPACGTRMIHPDKTAGHCILTKDHEVEVEDSDHMDEHGHRAPVLVHQSTIREATRVAAEWPDGIHTCAELQRTEPGRRPCTCGRCPTAS
jgi:hypothetical protein